MNVDPTSNRYGEIVAWDSLSEADQQSGKWIKLPATDENGQPVMARRRSLIEELYGDRAPREIPRDFFAPSEDRMRRIKAQIAAARSPEKKHG